MAISALKNSEDFFSGMPKTGTPTNFSSSIERKKYNEFFKDSNKETKQNFTGLTKAIQQLNKVFVKHKRTDSFGKMVDETINIRRETKQNIINDKFFKKRVMEPFYKRSIELAQKQTAAISELLIITKRQNFRTFAKDIASTISKFAATMFLTSGKLVKSLLVGGIINPTVSTFGGIFKFIGNIPNAFRNFKLDRRNLLGTLGRATFVLQGIFSLFETISKMSNIDDILKSRNLKKTLGNKINVAVSTFVNTFTFGLTDWISKKLLGKDLIDAMNPLFEGLEGIIARIGKEFEVFSVDPTKYVTDFPGRITSLFKRKIEPMLASALGGVFTFLTENIFEPINTGITNLREKHKEFGIQIVAFLIGH